jgi:hypothetical protein
VTRGIDVPSRPRTLHPDLDEGLARGFGVAATDREPSSAERGVVHSFVVVVEIRDRFVDRLGVADLEVFATRCSKLAEDYVSRIGNGWAVAVVIAGRPRFISTHSWPQHRENGEQLRFVSVRWCRWAVRVAGEIRDLATRDLSTSTLVRRPWCVYSETSRQAMRPVVTACRRDALELRPRVLKTGSQSASRSQQQPSMHHGTVRL